MLALLMSACVYEDEVPCPCKLRFVYDHNMEWADAFASQVEKATLFIFDDQERFITTKTIDCKQLNNNTLDLQLAPGRYTLVAWATSGDAGCYQYENAMKEGTSTLQDLKLKLQCQAGEEDYGKNPADLWHGMLKDFHVQANQPTSDTLRLLKNTNRIKVLLQSVDGSPVGMEDYSLAITDANHAYAHDNSVLPHLATLTYRPYQTREVTIDNSAATPDAASRAEADAPATISAITAEMATLRLMADRSPRFIVHNERTGRDLFNINLREYLDKMRLSEHANLPLQEFLDRENTWQVILVMGQKNDGTKVMLSLQINAWRIIFNDVSL